MLSSSSSAQTPQDKPIPITFDDIGCTGKPVKPVYKSKLPIDDQSDRWSNIIQDAVKGASANRCLKVLRIAPRNGNGNGDSTFKPIDLSIIENRNAHLSLLAAIHINPNDQCFDRAHLLVSRLQSVTPTHGKIFIRGDVYNPHTGAPWEFHVAAVLAVTEQTPSGPKVSLRVLDPALKEGSFVYTLDEWLTGVTKAIPNGKKPQIGLEFAARQQLFPSITEIGARDSSGIYYESFMKSCKKAKEAKAFEFFGKDNTSWTINSKLKFDCTNPEWCVMTMPEKRGFTRERFAIPTILWPKEHLEKLTNASMRVSANRKTVPLPGVQGIVTSIMQMPPDNVWQDIVCRDF